MKPLGAGRGRSYSAADQSQIINCD